MTGLRYSFWAAVLATLAACGGSEREPEQAGTSLPSEQAEVEVIDTFGPLPNPDVPEPGPVGRVENGESAPPIASEGASQSRSMDGQPAPGAPVPPAAPSTPPTQAAEPLPAGTGANDILERAERAYSAVRSMEADFVQTIEVPLLDSRQSGRGKIYHRAPDLFAMRFSEPDGDVIVADGQYVWMYYPSSDPRQVVRSPLAQGAQQVDLQRQFLSDASERFEATLTGTEMVGGRQTHALTLVPRGSSPYRRIRIWVDTQDHLVRRFEIVEQNESVRTLEMSNLRPNVDLPDGIFRFTPPAGAEVFEP